MREPPPMIAFRLTAGAVVHRLATLPRSTSVAAFGVVSVFGVRVIRGTAYLALVLPLPTARNQVTGGGPRRVTLPALVNTALFRAVLARVRDRVGRRLDRGRYSAQRTPETFGTRRTEQIELRSVARRLAAVADSTVRPARTTVWLRERRS